MSNTYLIFLDVDGVLNPVDGIRVDGRWQRGTQQRRMDDEMTALHLQTPRVGEPQVVAVGHRQAEPCDVRAQIDQAPERGPLVGALEELDLTRRGDFEVELPREAGQRGDKGAGDALGAERVRRRRDARGRDALHRRIRWWLVALPEQKPDQHGGQNPAGVVGPDGEQGGRHLQGG